MKHVFFNCIVQCPEADPLDKKFDYIYSFSRSFLTRMINFFGQLKLITTRDGHLEVYTTRDLALYDDCRHSFVAQLRKHISDDISRMNCPRMKCLISRLYMTLHATKTKTVFTEPCSYKCL